MIEFEILADGGAGGLRISVIYQPGRTMPSDEATAGWVEEAWQQSLARAQREGVPLYDGKLFRLERFQVEGRQLRLLLGDTGYKEYVATRRPEFRRSSASEKDQSFPEGANPLAVCAAIVTADAKILVERRRGLDVYPGRYHVIGGFFERDKDDGMPPNPAKAIQREVREETGLHLARSRFACLGLVYDLATPHPELCFTATADATFAEVSRRRGTDGEVQHLESVEATPESLRSFVLANHGNLSATGEPCLLLYGKRRFGSAWFDAL